MKSKNLNNSSKKTIELIKNTFCKIFEEKNDLSKISVVEICEQAQINRSTFYLHYDSIANVAESIQEDIQDALFSNLEDCTDLKTYFIETFIYLKTNEAQLKALITTDGPMNFLRKFKKMVANHYVEYFLSDTTDKEKELYIQITVDGMVEQYVKYIRGKTKFTLDELENFAIKWLDSIQGGKEF